LRASNLKSGIMALFNDPNFEGLAKRLYQRAAISPLGPGDASKTSAPGSNGLLNFLPSSYKQSLPSYIEKSRFAGALLDLTGLSIKHAALAAEGKTGPQAANSLNDIVGEIADPRSSNCCRGSSADARGTSIRLVNLDTIRIATVLWEEPAIAQKLKDVVPPTLSPKTNEEPGGVYGAERPPRTVVAGSRLGSEERRQMGLVLERSQ
jgi:hypothetical protein